MQYQAPTNVEVWQGCLALLLELHGLPPRDWGITQRGLSVAHIIAEVAGVNWTDFCRVLNSAGGDWERIGTGKWDAAIPDSAALLPVIELLLKYGADTAAIDENGQTACQYAEKRDLSQAVLNLLCR